MEEPSTLSKRPDFNSGASVPVKCSGAKSAGVPSHEPLIATLKDLAVIVGFMSQLVKIASKFFPDNIPLKVVCWPICQSKSPLHVDL